MLENGQKMAKFSHFFSLFFTQKSKKFGFFQKNRVFSKVSFLKVLIFALFFWFKKWTHFWKRVSVKVAVSRGPTWQEFEKNWLVFWKKLQKSGIIKSQKMTKSWSKSGFTFGPVFWKVYLIFDPFFGKNTDFCRLKVVKKVVTKSEQFYFWFEKKRHFEKKWKKAKNFAPRKWWHAFLKNEPKLFHFWSKTDRVLVQSAHAKRQIFTFFAKKVNFFLKKSVLAILAKIAKMQFFKQMTLEPIFPLFQNGPKVVKKWSKSGQKVVKKWSFFSHFWPIFGQNMDPFSGPLFLQKRLLLYNVCDKKWSKREPEMVQKVVTKSWFNYFFKNLAILSFCKFWKKWNLAIL